MEGQTSYYVNNVAQLYVRHYESKLKHIIIQGSGRGGGGGGCKVGGGESGIHLQVSEIIFFLNIRQLPDYYTTLSGSLSDMQQIRGDKCCWHVQSSRR